MKEDSVCSRERLVWAAETPVLLVMELETGENVGRRSGDENCGSELEVRVEYLGSGDLISGGCDRGYVSTYSIIKIQGLEIPLSCEFGFFVGGHK